MIGVNNVFSVTVNNPMTENLDGGGYKITNISDIVTKGPWVDARSYNNGAFNDVTISAAITAIGSANKTLLLAPGTWTISANVTVPSNINLKFEQGSVLSIGAGYTFNVNGPVDAPLSQIFSGSGLVRGKVLIPAVNPIWFGAVEDSATGGSGTNNAAAIQAAADWCKNDGLALVFTHHEGYAYRISSGVDLTGIRNITMNNAIIMADKAIGTAVTVGEDAHCYIDLHVQRQFVTTWAPGDINILIKNVTNSYFKLRSTHGDTGVKVLAEDTKIVAYNTFLLGVFNINKVGIYATKAGTGANNDNLYLHGEFGNTESGADVCIRLENCGQSNFIGTSFEHESGINGIEFNGSSTNYCGAFRVRFDHPEGFTGDNVKFLNNAYANVVTYTAFTGSVKVNDSGVGSTFDYDNIVVADIDAADIYKAHVITQDLAPYNDGTYIHAPDFMFYIHTDDTFYRKTNDANFEILPDGYLKLTDYTDGVGVLIESPEEIYVDVDYKGGMDAMPILYIICYDSNWGKLTGISPYYATGRTFSSSYNGYLIYHKGVLRFNSNVKYAWIGVVRQSGKDPAMIRKIDIYGATNKRIVYNKYSGIRETTFYLAAGNSPTKAAFYKGQAVYNDTPGASTTAGWVCIDRRDTTISSGGGTGSNVIVVADATGIASGDIIGIVLNDGTYHWTTVNGTPNGNNVTLTSALPYYASAGNAVVTNRWKAMANLAP